MRRPDIEIYKPKTTVDIQNDLEKERAWIRKLNCKIYDNKISNLVADTTNGSELLKKEISDSEQRLQLVKSGISMRDLVHNHDPRFFVNDLKPYFRGTDKILRNLERRH